ncbi:MAG: YceK/YidQ family lipoprotein [Mobilitalea sp.]
MKKSLIIFLIVFFFTSCATTTTRILPNVKGFYQLNRQYYYPATNTDMMYMIGAPFIAYDGRPSMIPIAIALILGSLIDLPISLTTDTILLPVDIYIAHNQQKQNDASTKEPTSKQE